jgi:hypothetical protein
MSARQHRYAIEGNAKALQRNREWRRRSPVGRRLHLDDRTSAQRRQRWGIEVDIDDAPGRQTGPKPHGLHGRFLVDLEGNAGFERQPERQDERTGDSITIRSVQLDGEDALTVLLRLDLRQDAPFSRTFMNASDASILIGLVK